MRGDRFLVDSNFDWGQDLIYFARMLQLPRFKSMKPKLAYFGSIRPEDICSNVDLVECPKDESVHWPPGLYAISSNLVQGYCMPFPGKTGVFTPENHDTFRQFRDVHPIATAGYSIRIYQIDD